MWVSQSVTDYIAILYVKGNLCGQLLANLSVHEECTNVPMVCHKKSVHVLVNQKWIKGDFCIQLMWSNWDFSPGIMEKPNVHEPMFFKTSDIRQWRKVISERYKKNKVSFTIDPAYWLESFQATIQGRIDAEPGGLPRWRDRAESLERVELLELAEYQQGGSTQKNQRTGGTLSQIFSRGLMYVMCEETTRSPTKVTGKVYSTFTEHWTQAGPIIAYSLQPHGKNSKFAGQWV